jgi:hypothetical protein
MRHAPANWPYYRCYTPGCVPLVRLVHIARLRWTTEEDFAASKALAGLEKHQVRRWTSWYRWVTLAMLALALLTVAAAADRRPAGQVPLTRNEIARLLTLPMTPRRGLCMTLPGEVHAVGLASAASQSRSMP